MAVLLAFCSAICSSFSTIITKKGIKDVESNLATLIRICFTFLFTLVIIIISRSYENLSAISAECLLPLLLSGVCSGFSWLFYFKALSLGDVSKLTPVDNLSTVLTMLLAILILHESVTPAKIAAMLLIFFGTVLMVGLSRRHNSTASLTWLPFALLAMVTASCSSILVKLALKQLDSTLVTGIRNLISLLIAAALVIQQKQYKGIRQITPKNWFSLVASGLLIGVAALCNYQALQLGEASVIVPIDKSSMFFVILLSCLFLHERPNRQNWAGLFMIAFGTVLLVV